MGPGEKVCLVIAVAETKNVVSIIGQSLCPIRVQTGISWRACEEIRNSKVHVSSQNYNFIVDLDNFVHDYPPGGMKFLDHLSLSTNGLKSGESML